MVKRTSQIAIASAATVAAVAGGYAGLKAYVYHCKLQARARRVHDALKFAATSAIVPYFDETFFVNLLEAVLDASKTAFEAAVSTRPPITADSSSEDKEAYVLDTLHHAIAKAACFAHMFSESWLAVRLACVVEGIHLSGRRVPTEAARTEFRAGVMRACLSAVPEVYSSVLGEVTGAVMASELSVLDEIDTVTMMNLLGECTASAGVSVNGAVAIRLVPVRKRGEPSRLSSHMLAHVARALIAHSDEAKPIFEAIQQELSSALINEAPLDPEGLIFVSKLVSVFTAAAGAIAPPRFTHPLAMQLGRMPLDSAGDVARAVYDATVKRG